MTEAMALLFSYGTLQRTDVQVATFGRTLAGRPDVLPNHALQKVRIEDPAAAEALGMTHYENAVPTGNAGDGVPGTVLEVTPEELARCDAYEAPSGYRRVEVSLRSGTVAWRYAKVEGF